jgi:hypothetical protein
VWTSGGVPVVGTSGAVTFVGGCAWENHPAPNNTITLVQDPVDPTLFDLQFWNPGIHDPASLLGTVQGRIADQPTMNCRSRDWLIVPQHPADPSPWLRLRAS